MGINWPLPSYMCCSTPGPLENTLKTRQFIPVPSVVFAAASALAAGAPVKTLGGMPVGVDNVGHVAKP